MQLDSIAASAEAEKTAAIEAARVAREERNAATEAANVAIEAARVTREERDAALQSARVAQEESAAQGRALSALSAQFDAWKAAHLQETADVAPISGSEIAAAAGASVGLSGVSASSLETTVPVVSATPSPGTGAASVGAGPGAGPGVGAGAGAGAAAGTNPGAGAGAGVSNPRPAWRAGLPLPGTWTLSLQFVSFLPAFMVVWMSMCTGSAALRATWFHQVPGGP